MARLMVQLHANGHLRQPFHHLNAIRSKIEVKLDLGFSDYDFLDRADPVARPDGEDSSREGYLPVRCSALEIVIRFRQQDNVVFGGERPDSSLQNGDTVSLLVGLRLHPVWHLKLLMPIGGAGQFDL